MRRIGLIATVVLLALAAPARASDHLMQVNEVAPGPAATGFVELLDPFGEPFPQSAYTLASFDAAGSKLAEQRLAPPYGFAGSTAPFVLDAASTPALALPTAATGKVCFYRGAGTGDPIDCLAYRGVGAGQSAQRQSCGLAANGPPSKGARNPRLAGACTADRRPPRLGLRAGRRQRLSALALALAAGERATVTVTGSARVGARRLAIRRVRFTAKPGVRRSLRLRFPAARRRAIGAALRAGTAVVLRLRIAATDRAGNTAVVRRSIRLRS